MEHSGNDTVKHVYFASIEFSQF